LTQAAGMVEEFHVPLPEALIHQVNKSMVGGTAAAILSTIRIDVVSDNPVIYFGQGADGWEPNPGNPTNKTTLIWGLQIHPIAVLG